LREKISPENMINSFHSIHGEKNFCLRL